jgi:hypothetical protein
VQLRLRPKDDRHPLLVDMGQKVEDVRDSAGASLKKRNEWLKAYGPAQSAYIALKNALKANNPALIAQAQQTYSPLLATSDGEYDKLEAAVKVTRDKIEELRKLAERVLEREWTRVKAGETNYQILELSLYVLGGMAVAAALVAAAWYLLHSLELFLYVLGGAAVLAAVVATFWYAAGRLRQRRAIG